LAHLAILPKPVGPWAKGAKKECAESALLDQGLEMALSPP